MGSYLKSVSLFLRLHTCNRSYHACSCTCHSPRLAQSRPVTTTTAPNTYVSCSRCRLSPQLILPVRHVDTRGLECRYNAGCVHKMSNRPLFTSFRFFFFFTAFISYVARSLFTSLIVRLFLSVNHSIRTGGGVAYCHNPNIFRQIFTNINSTSTSMTRSSHGPSMVVSLGSSCLEKIRITLLQTLYLFFHLHFHR